MKKLTAILLLMTLSPLPVFAQDPTPTPTPVVTEVPVAPLPDFYKRLHEDNERWLASLRNPPPPPTEKPRSTKLAWTGGWLLGGGSALLLMSLPWSFGETYELNHDPYCVDIGTRRVNIDEGACYSEATPELRPYGYAMVAAGSALLVIGLQKVQIRPTLAPGVVGAKARIRW